MLVSAFLVVIDRHRACCSEFAVTVMPAIYIDWLDIDRRVDYTETCTSLVPSTAVGLAGAQLGVKTPSPIHEGALRHTYIYYINNIYVRAHVCTIYLFFQLRS